MTNKGSITFNSYCSCGELIISSFDDDHDKDDKLDDDDDDEFNCSEFSS